MNMQKRTLGLLLFLLPFLMVSCHTKEKLVYFQDGGSDSTEVRDFNYTPTLKVDDFLNIYITSDQPELTVPFNTPPPETSSGGQGGYTTGNPVSTGYLIDEKGFISLPIIGDLQLANLNRMDAANLIKAKLKDYLSNPQVIIQIQNFKITILGDVKRPGTFRIPNERITILEAMGLAGDLNITGVRNNILLIREEDGKKTEYRIDLTKKDFLNSPVYFLQQNDVIYVEPNMTARSVSTMWRATGGIVISLTSLIISTVVLITK